MSRATPKVPTVYHDHTGWLQRIAYVVNALVDGRHNGHGEVTLASATTVTVVSDQRVGAASRVFLSPRSANAAGETIHVSETTSAAFSLTHASAASSDRTFDYLIVG